MATTNNFERQLISMLSAAVSGAAADGAYEAFIANAECKLTGVLPQTACIYVYALSAPGAHRPCAVYIGQSVRDAYTRLREHLRRGRTAAEAQLVSLLGAGNTMRILAMPAPEDALNTLERIGLRWLMENAYSVRILNTDWAGANHCASGAGDEARSPYVLRPISEFGSAVDSFALSRVADALDDYERSLSSDALSDIDALGTIVLGCPDAQYGLQAVSVSADGTAHILAGAPMLLAARRTESCAALRFAHTRQRRIQRLTNRQRCAERIGCACDSFSATQALYTVQRHGPCAHVSLSATEPRLRLRSWCRRYTISRA